MHNLWTLYCSLKFTVFKFWVSISTETFASKDVPIVFEIIMK